MCVCASTAVVLLDEVGPGVVLLEVVVDSDVVSTYSVCVYASVFVCVCICVFVHLFARVFV